MLPVISTVESIPLTPRKFNDDEAYNEFLQKHFFSRKLTEAFDETPKLNDLTEEPDQDMSQQQKDVEELLNKLPPTITVIPLHRLQARPDPSPSPSPSTSYSSAPDESLSTLSLADELIPFNKPCSHEKCINIPVDIQVAINAFIYNASIDSQKSFVKSCVEGIELKHWNHYKFKYYLRWNGFEQQVCVPMFVHTTGLPYSRIYRWMKEASNSHMMFT